MGNIDSLKVGSGLLDECDFEITDAAFVYEPGYKMGRVPLAKLKGLADGKEHTESYPVGDGWKIEGDTIVHESGSDARQVQGGTKYGMFIHAFATLDGAVETFGEIEGADTRKASSWVGFKFHMERRQGTYDGLIDEKTGEPVKYNVLEPTALLGYTLSGAAPAAAAPAVEIPADVNEALTDLAKKSANFDVFINAAYDIVEGLKGSEFEEYVADDSSSGYYASVS